MALMLAHVRRPGSQRPFSMVFRWMPFDEITAAVTRDDDLRRPRRHPAEGRAQPWHWAVLIAPL